VVLRAEGDRVVIHLRRPIAVWRQRRLFRQMWRSTPEVAGTFLRRAGLTVQVKAGGLPAAQLLPHPEWAVRLLAGGA